MAAGSLSSSAKDRGGAPVDKRSPSPSAETTRSSSRCEPDAPEDQDRDCPMIARRRVSWGDIEECLISPAISPALSPANRLQAEEGRGGEEEDESEALERLEALRTKAERRRARRSVAPRHDQLTSLVVGNVASSSLLRRRLSNFQPERGATV